jgi:hypothetical protein
MNRPASVVPIESGDQSGLSDLLEHEIMNSRDRELEDLIFSWRRVSDPNLRRIALKVVRSMAS